MNHCCQKPENLKPAELPDAKKKIGLSMRCCQVCGNRHFELDAKAGVIGLRGVGLGEKPAEA